jgi:hypothetical protein
MADGPYLHQIEYRHHQTRDFSPAASSMPSRESLAGWDTRVRAWVRHPHSDELRESACYQVFANGRAALAWRYQDERFTIRPDGTSGRPLCSRVLVGPETLLTPKTAVALSRTGPTAALVGSLPGEVPDDATLPTVAGDELRSLVQGLAPVLDREAEGVRGLQAVVAAALMEPVTPLGVFLPEEPLNDGVQGLLVWGLLQITEPLLGSTRSWGGWSFSTYEHPLGDRDPATLPAIVFRQVAPRPMAPSRYRVEAKVRPYDPTALDPGMPYGDRLELAGRLVDEYRKRGGPGLRQFIEGCCGTEEPVEVRVQRLEETLAGASSRNELVSHSTPPPEPPELLQYYAPEPQALGPPLLPRLPRTVSAMLRQLELLGEDQRQFESILDNVYQEADGITPEERARSWDVITRDAWYENTCQHNSFRSMDLARILHIVVIPELADNDQAVQAIARWAVQAPDPMLEGLGTAARVTSSQMWQLVTAILVPALACRWAVDHFMRDQWDGDRVARSSADLGRRAARPGFFGKRARG